MGLDIFLYGERREASGPWALIGGMEENLHFFLGDESVQEPFPAMMPRELYDERNYDLFAILADVRNGTRTAEGSRFEPICPPRGMPEDLCPELLEWTTLWDGDDGQLTRVAAGWLRLDEVLEYPWRERRILREAMVDRRAAHLFPGAGRYVSDAEVRQGFPADEWPPDADPGVSEYLRGGVVVRWWETYEEAVGPAFFALVERLRQLGPPHDTRLVFWFD